MITPSRTRLGRTTVRVAGLGLIAASVMAQGSLAAQAQSGPTAPQVSVSEVRIGRGDVCTEPVVISVDVEISAPDGTDALFIGARGVNQAEFSVGLWDSAPEGSSLGTGYSGTVDITIEAGNPSGEWQLLTAANGVGSAEAALRNEVFKSFTLPGNCPDNDRGIAVNPIGRVLTVTSASFEQAAVSVCSGPARNAVVVELNEFDGSLDQIEVLLDGPGTAPTVSAKVVPSASTGTRQVIPFELPTGTTAGTWSLAQVTLDDGAPFVWQPTADSISFAVATCNSLSATPPPKAVMTATPAPVATAGPVATTTPKGPALAYTGSKSIELTVFGSLVVLVGVSLVIASGRAKEIGPE